MDILVMVIVFAMLVEALVEDAKTIGKAFLNKEYKTAVTQLAAVMLGIVLCVAGDADMFVVLGITFNIDMLGTVLTGIIISRGANYASDIMKRIQSIVSGELVLGEATEVSTDEK